MEGKWFIVCNYVLKTRWVGCSGKTTRTTITTSPTTTTPTITSNTTTITIHRTMWRLKYLSIHSVSCLLMDCSVTCQNTYTGLLAALNRLTHHQQTYSNGHLGVQLILSLGIQSRLGYLIWFVTVCYLIRPRGNFLRFVSLGFIDPPLFTRCKTENTPAASSPLVQYLNQ